MSGSKARSPQRTLLAFTAWLVVAVVVLSAVANGRAAQRRVTGIVTEVVAGQWLRVANEQTGHPGARIAWRAATVSLQDPAAITPGTRVTVWHRYVGEAMPVADRVLVLASTSSR